MKHPIAVLILCSMSLVVSAAENPFDEQSFESVTKSDTDALRDEINSLRNEVSIMQSRKDQADTPSEEGAQSQRPMARLMIVNGQYFVRPISGGLPIKASKSAFESASAGGY